MRSKKKMQKATVSFVMSVPFFRMEQLSCHWRDFHEIFFNVFSTVHHSRQLFHQPTLMHNPLFILFIQTYC